MSKAPYFLPYQTAYLDDRSRYKIVKKSRRVGFTYIQSYEDVRDAAQSDGFDVWFSSADESAAREYILYCQQWAKWLDLAARDLGEVVVDKDKDVNVLSIQFASGNRINALTRNPTRFNSKGGKVVLDEFAKHPNQEAMWRAAQPVTTHGYPLRVLSTYEGRGNLYYRLTQDAEKANSVWSLHSTTIVDAVDQGLADLIAGRRLSAQERQAWLDEARALAMDEATWQQEYLCNPVDEATAWLPWELITRCESPQAGQPERYQGGPCYLGMDIGRRRDLTAIWVAEMVGDVLFCREVICLRNASFSEQESRLDDCMRRYRIIRASLDETGMGCQFCERAQERWGRYRVQGVLFTQSSKLEMAIAIKQSFEDLRCRIPADPSIRDAHHAIRKIPGVSAPRFDADRSEVGHADEFWAHALCTIAAKTPIIDYGAYDPIEEDPSPWAGWGGDHRRMSKW